MPHIQQHQGQEEAGEHTPIPNVGFVQVKAVAFQVPVHFIRPHAATVGPQRLAPYGVGCSQKPGGLLSSFPMGQHVALMPVAPRQQDLPMPAALAGDRDHILQGRPIVCFGKIYPCTSFLAQAAYRASKAVCLTLRLCPSPLRTHVQAKGKARRRKAKLTMTT